MGSLIGFGGLVMAHNPSIDSSLNPSGDTMEMMRAVLVLLAGDPCGDHNHWIFHHFLAGIRIICVIDALSQPD